MRTSTLGNLFLSSLVGLMACGAASVDAAEDRPRPPNVIFILADDLGYAELGCYGQTKIRTPNIDALAKEGMRFTQYYSGSPVCAPSRCTLLTGLHTGHAAIRDNREWKPEGQQPMPADTVTLPKLLKQAGYRTGAMGKWGLGGPGSGSEPGDQGFDRWYGYLCQRVAHTYYPEYLWSDRTKVALEGNVGRKQQTYSHDLIAEEGLKFIRESGTGDARRQPFFLYLPFTIPHAALQVPADSLAEYKGAFEETPYDGSKGYTPHPTPRAAYAAMVSRMDRSVGQVMALLKELKLDEETIVLFSSDNGPTYNGGSDSAFFQSAGPFRGLKGSVYEGGIRVPLIARWPGRIKPGATSDHVCASWDVMPTLLELAGATAPAAIDGVSFAPTLLGQGEQRKHDYLYWEYHAAPGSQAVRMGDWKAVRRGVRKDRNAPVALYDLKADVGEQNDVAQQHPEVLARVTKIMSEARTESDVWTWGPPPKK